MSDRDFRKAFGARVKETRKSRKLTQKELAQLVGLHFQMLNKYEGGQILPQPEKIVALANGLGVSVDFLLTGKTPENCEVSDVRLVQRFNALNHFRKEDQEAILLMIDAINLRSSVQGTFEKLHLTAGTAG